MKVKHKVQIGILSAILAVVIYLAIEDIESK